MAKNTGKGKFYQDPKTRLWRIDTRVNINGNYYHIEKRGFATKHEAQAAYNSILQSKIEAVNAKSIKNTAVMFEQFIEEFEQWRSNKVCSSTINLNDYYVVKNHFAPTFAGKPISSVFTPKVFIRWYDDIACDKNLSAPRRNKAISLAKAMLKFAYRRKYISAEEYHDCDLACESIKEPQIETKKHVLWNNEQVYAFLSAIPKDSADYIMFSLLVELAPRIGEFLGLTGDCVNAKEGYIEIKQQVVYESNGQINLVSRVKSNESKRKLPIVSPQLKEMLLHYIESEGIKANQFLFSPYGNHDKPLSRTEFRRKLTAYCNKANVPVANPHAFRHMLSTYLSQNCRTNEDVETAAKILGHTPAVEWNIYRHNGGLEGSRSLLERSRRHEA